MGSTAIREVKTISDLSRAFRPHVHDELSVAYVWSGATLAWIDGKEVPVSGECVVVIPAGVAHACNPVAHSGWNYTLALLDLEVGAGLGICDGPYRILPATDRLRDSFLALRQGQDVSSSGVLAALESVLVEPGEGPAGIGMPPRSRVLRRVMDHLRSHLAAPLSLEELGLIAGLSKYHLLRTFKQAYGLTPHAYLLNLRVNEAKTRLKLGQDLAETALECGFYDQSHFTRVFSRGVGMTPAAYQQAMAIPSKTLERPHH